ncbi:Transketolase, C-terminal section [Hyphomicrobiales bacterium]|nr:Transketolase, C-terminal section [Hyphomicrobiales bacterium]CAH1693511.1 Transketolase, C-terminal section [Hyphomicrobiales bacterium]
MNAQTTQALAVDDFIARTPGAGVLQKIWGDALAEAGARDSRIICLCADVSSPTEADRFRDRLPERFYQVGIAEANMVGIAAGMARMGDIPFIHSFCVFATKRCYDQLTMQVAYPRLNMKIVGFMPGLTTDLGVTHQAIEDVALMRVMPNMTVLEPAGQEQYRSAVATALEIDGPVYLRMMRAYGDENPERLDHPLEVGKGYVIEEGGHGAIFATGMMVQEARRAAAELRAEGLHVTVVNMSSIKPLDHELVIQLAAKTGAVVTAENHSIIGGLGSAVAETLMEAGVSCAFRRIGVRDTFAEGASTPYLFDKYGLSARSIALACRETIASRRN